MAVLEALTTETACQLNVLWHDRDAAAVDRTQACVSEKVHHVCFRGFLDGKHGAGLEPQALLALRRDFTHQALERQLAQQQFRALLVAADLAQRDGAWAEAERLLHTA